MSLIVKIRNPITHSVRVALVTLAFFVLLGIVVRVKRASTKEASSQHVSSASQSTLSPFANALLIPRLILPVNPDAPESDWNVALTRRLGGEAEVSVEFGRIDVLTKNYAIEIDFFPKWQEGIGQSLHYSDATDHTPCLALIVTSPNPDIEKLRYIDELCRKKGVTLIILSPDKPNGSANRSIDTYK